MVVTPWGYSGTLRDRGPRPGPGTPHEEVAENQRQRLFAAMVASVDERGYAATTVANLLAISGVSRKSFYNLFAGKRDCFVATLEAILPATIELGRAAGEEGTAEERLRARIDRFAQAIVAQPATARLCLVEAPAAGSEAGLIVATRIERAEALLRRDLAASAAGKRVPKELVTVGLGAAIEIARTRLLQGRESELPELSAKLAGLLIDFPPPPKTLKRGGRQTPAAQEPLEAHDHADRAIQAFETLLMEQGFPELKMEQVAKRASMSTKTLYANFGTKEEILAAAVDSAGSRIVAAVLPALRRNPSWPAGVRAAYGALFGLLASRPTLANFIFVAAPSGGRAAFERRAATLWPLDQLFSAGRLHSPHTDPLAGEAALGGIFALIEHQLRRSGAESLPGLTAIATYSTLAPFLGAEWAALAARGEGQDRGPRQYSQSVKELAVRPETGRVLTALTGPEVTPREIAKATGLPLPEVRERLAELRAGGLIDQIAERVTARGTEPIYAATQMMIMTDRWEQVPIEQREKVSAEILQLIDAEIDHSVETGAFDARGDRHLLRIPFSLDRQGWRELDEAFDQHFERCLEIKEKSGERLRSSAETPIDARAILMLFELHRP